MHVKMRTKGLRFKINGAILLASVIVALFAGSILYPVEINRRAARLEQIESLLKAVFLQKKEAIANEVFADQLLALQHTLRDIHRVHGVAQLSIYDLDGHVILATESGAPRHLAPQRMARLDDAALFHKTRINGRSLAAYTTLIEVIGERVGYITIYYDLTALERESILVAGFFLSMLLAVLAVMALFLNLLLTRAVIQPAGRLRDAIGKVRAGNLGEQVTIASADEIGEMAADFNAMSQKLQEQHVALNDAVQTKESYAQKLAQSNRQLADLNTNLEARVESRTEELKRSYERLEQEMIERKRAFEEKRRLEEQLVRSQKMEALGMLAGGVAHDLNNVLSGIVSYPELLLLQLQSDSPLRAPIKTIQDSGQKAAAIVQDLLTLTRRGVINADVLDLNKQIVEPYLRSPEYEKLMTAHPGARISVKLAEDLLPIKGSTIHLTKTLMNLVTNAAESIEDRGHITISTENRYADLAFKDGDNVQEGEYAVLIVSDTGLGIAPEDLDRIFEPFYTRKKMGRSGTGLGMAVVWGTVQDHNGQINVQSREGVGTTFELFFPATREALSANDQAFSLAALAGQGEKILVVDDVPAQREITSSILAELGYRVATVPGGEAALAYLEKHSADLMILDMIMPPGMDGLETYRRILARHPDQKAVIASGFAENERVRAALELGAGLYIRKPFTLEKIGRAVKMALADPPPSAIPE